MPTIAQRREIIVRQQAERKARAKKARTETAEQNAERQKIAESWAAAEKRADRVWRGLPPTEAESTTRAKQIAAKYNGRDGAEPDKKQTETEKEIERLARLSGLYYERERQGIAAKMGVRVSRARLHRQSALQRNQQG